MAAVRYHYDTITFSMRMTQAERDKLDTLARHTSQTAAAIVRTLIRLAEPAHLIPVSLGCPERKDARHD